ncbi:MAG TPA: DUF92 domain-containing protein [Panacibacter sp.]|nr:DUF92 domain-containing protein [Panacibacter sp.]HNP43422.1 DUF92 domain-containing protein [Panacibacter sp.]
MFDLQHIIVYLFLISGAALSFYKNKLTLSAALVAILVGFFVYCGGGLTALAMLVAFFISGTWATRHQWTKKEQLKLTEKRSGARNAMQVVANGGVAAALAAMMMFDASHNPVYLLMIAASLSSATADTLSSELGNVYGKRYFNVTSFAKDDRGRDGVVSIEGTLAGIAGSLIIGLVYAAGLGFSANVLMIIIAGMAGNLFDSLLGATLQRKGYISNDIVNLLNTMFAALITFIIAF